MKMDKETLIKHQFWILLGVFSVVALVLLILITTIIGADAQAKQTAIDKMKSDVDAAGRDIKSRPYIKILDEQKDVLSNKRGELWGEMYDKQKGLLYWPGDMRYSMGKKYADFGMDINRDDAFDFAEENIYLHDYEEMADIIKPTEYQGGWKAVLSPVAWSPTTRPTSDEVWLALEDMCVRRELLHLLHQANQAVATFEEQPVPKEEKLPPTSLGPKFAKRFQSRWYQLDISLDRKDRDYTFHVKLKNISGRRQVIYQMELNVWVSPNPSETEPARPVLVQIPATDLAADQVLEKKDVKVNINQFTTGVLRVEQALNIRTVPIKRLKELDLGHNPGHRKFDPTLKTVKAFQKEGDAKPAADPNAGPGLGSRGGMPSAPGAMSPGMPGGNMPGFGGDPNAASGDMTPNGLNKKRYIDVTDQVRRLPITLVMTIDQNSIPDVLVALSNSKLRFQITQVHWSRIHTMPPNSASETPGTPAGPATSSPPRGGGASSDIRPGSGFRPGSAAGATVGAMSPRGTGAMPAGSGFFPPSSSSMPGGTSAEHALSSDQQTANLVDLTVYGVATLYERPKDAAAAKTPISPSSTTTPTSTPAPGAPTNPKEKSPTSPVPTTPTTDPNAKAPAKPADSAPSTPDGKPPVKPTDGTPPMPDAKTPAKPADATAPKAPPAAPPAEPPKPSEKIEQPPKPADKDAGSKPK